MVTKTKNGKKLIRPNQSTWGSNKDNMVYLESIVDADVKQALEIYQCAINRYNHADLSDPKVENVYFLERQIAFIGLQVALAKARIREGIDPSLDYTSFESILKYVGLGR